jgi:hypothetical protein
MKITAANNANGANAAHRIIPDAVICCVSDVLCFSNNDFSSRGFARFAATKVCLL